MKFQKIISIICILLVTIILFTACSATTEEPLLTDGGQTEETTDSQNTEKQTSDDNDTNKDSNENINKGECSGEHYYEEKSRVEAMALKDGEITYVCSVCQDEKKEIIPAIKEAVKNAMEKNFEITQSLFTSGSFGGSSEVIDPSEVLEAENYIEADRALAALNGVDIDDYELLEWDYVENAYWHCTQRTYWSHPKSTSSTYKQNICSEKMYSTDEELPAGTIFICDSGWRYLLEIFPDENEIYTGTRHTGTTENFYILTENFLNGCKYIAWDVSSYPKTDISSIYHQAAVHIRVYVPKA